VLLLSNLQVFALCIGLTFPYTLRGKAEINYEKGLNVYTTAAQIKSRSTKATLEEE
jgi:hypothetical protein